MDITQIRNATLRIAYAGRRFLVDPMLAAAGAYPGYPGTLNSHRSNPLVDLPLPLEAILAVDAVIVTHTHPDHWDEAALRLVPRHLPVFVQDARDAAEIGAAGFGDVRILGDATEFEGIRLTRTGGQHGSDAAMAAIGAMLGAVCGVVFRHPGERTLYVAGDTLWNPEVEAALRRHGPEVIVLNAGEATVSGIGAITMGVEDVLAVQRAAPGATILASHMEAVNHAALPRAVLRDAVAKAGLSARILVPEDGETLRF